MDRFPEAFEKRYLEDLRQKGIDINKIQTFQQLLTSFHFWQVSKVKTVTNKQIRALKIEAKRHKIGYIEQRVIIRYKKPVTVHRDLITGRFTKKPD